MMKILLSINGEIDHYSDTKEMLNHYQFDKIVGVDGGLRHLNELAFYPDEMIGDFDSASEKEYAVRWPKALIKKFAAEKDETDFELAMRLLGSSTEDEVYVIGAFGGERIDHFIANLALLEKYPQMMLMDTKNQIVCVKGPYEYSGKIDEQVFRYFSLIPVSDSVEGIDLIGFKYPLKQARIDRSSAIGMSNEIEMKKYTVRIEKGTAIIIRSNGK